MKTRIILLIMVSSTMIFAQNPSKLGTNAKPTAVANKDLLLQRKWIFPVLGINIDGGISLKIENSKLPHRFPPELTKDESGFGSSQEFNFPEAMELTLLPDHRFVSKSNLIAFFEGRDSTYLKTMSGTWQLYNERVLVLFYPKLRVLYNVESLSDAEVTFSRTPVDFSKKNPTELPKDIILMSYLLSYITIQQKLPEIKPRRTMQCLLFGKSN